MKLFMSMIKRKTLNVVCKIVSLLNIMIFIQNKLFILFNNFILLLYVMAVGVETNDYFRSLGYCG